jgi:diguanylate cyclase (GGDEF)-like protein/PAS domain S-box-containing protein
LSTATGRKRKGFIWPKPAVLLFCYCSIVVFVELIALATKTLDPILLFFIAPVILAGFHYSRSIYLGMALLYTIVSNGLVLILFPNFSLLPAHQVILVIAGTSVIIAEIIHHIVVAQARTEQVLRNSEQSQKALIAIAERQARELSLLDHVRSALASELDPAEIYRSVVENIVQAFGYTQVSIYLRDGNDMVLQHQVGYAFVSPKIPVSQGIIGQVTRTGQAILLKDVHSSSTFLGTNGGIGSEMCVPLFDPRDPHKVLAVLNVESSQNVTLGEADLQMMKGLSMQASIAIGRARLHAEVKASEERFRALVENQGEGVAIVDGDEFFKFANPAAETIFGVSRDSLVGRNVKEFAPPEKVPFLLEQTENRRSGKRTSYEFEINRADGERRSLLITGTPQLDNTGAFTGTLAVFHDITDRKKMEEELRYLSTHDTLTGLYNRAYFETDLARLQSSRLFPISVFMIDVDGMKTVNDNYGHSAGDELLKRAARVLRNAFRNEDVVARIGGDEFAILVPGAPKAVAEAALVRLEANLALSNKDHPSNPLHLSIGMATGESGSILNEIFKEADSQMYLDKLDHHRMNGNQLASHAG